MSRRKLEFPPEAPVIPRAELEELIDYHEKAGGPYAERTVTALVALMVTQDIVRRERPKGRPRSLTLTLAIEIMHQLVTKHGATQKEAAKAVLSGPKATALLRAYTNAKSRGELNGIRGVVGPWADIAEQCLSLRKQKGRKGSPGE